ncbi:MAG: hypothetical protein BV459_01600 [Thermoplasmata archaeon M11B2D]|nr:MAG: hypothetical protein BV459_01600 [Thermoplasmata archaeon M11B2D]
MRVRRSRITSQQLDQDWLIEFGVCLNKINDEKKMQEIKKIFIEAYFENIQEGMNPREAIQKAKTIALCFF